MVALSPDARYGCITNTEAMIARLSTGEQEKQLCA